MSNTLPAAAFSGEISFAKTDDYIDTLRSLEVCIGRDVPQHFPDAPVDAAAFSAAARVLAGVEATQAWIGGLLPLAAVGRDRKTRHTLNWLNLSERKTSDEERHCHDLYVTVEGNYLQLTFNQGKFGYRRERHTKWSSAFARLSQLMAGECTWHQFGDPESQKTMLGKGQFYWQDQKRMELVPVDNFVFRIAGALEIRLSGVGHRCALNVELAGREDGHEWYADYAEGLLRMADVFAGVVDLEKFGEDSDPELHANTKPNMTPEVGAPPLSARGQFFVETIYEHRDVWAAPVLVYKTAEGKQAALHVTDTAWLVRLGAEQEKWKERRFTAATAPDALRTLARVLDGTLLYENF
jgi:hypothetical protein